MTTEGSPIETKEIKTQNPLMRYGNHFHVGKARFITIKSHEPKYQLDFVRKRCEKLGKSFIIVREKNKQKLGYHYHAIVECDKAPTANWYRKGVHMYVLEIGNTTGVVPKIPITFSDVEINTAIDDGLITPDEGLSMKLEKRVEQTIKKQKKRTHIEKVLHYMAKEQTQYVEFVNYYIKINGKRQTLPP